LKEVDSTMKTLAIDASTKSSGIAIF